MRLKSQGKEEEKGKERRGEECGGGGRKGENLRPTTLKHDTECM